MDMPSAIKAMTERRNLSGAEMREVMQLIMTGAATQAQIGGFLIGLRMKGESIDEIAAAAQVMRELAAGVKVSGEHVVDIVGTGGDSLHTFNISTTCCFIVAAAGGKVAKHGNRSVSSKSGSADVLEAAGVNLELTPEQVGRCINEVGVGFMFAPKHHSAMKHAIGPRREMGVRTIFNVLGPLTNPAGAPNLLLGVYHRQWLEPLAEVLNKLGAHHVMVVHSEDGMDEISIAAPTEVAELHHGAVKTYRIQPDDVGFERSTIKELVVESPQQSFGMIKLILEGHHGPARDIVAMNAGAALYVAGLAKDWKQGVQKAQEIIDSGAALQKLNELVKLSQSFK